MQTILQFSKVAMRSLVAILLSFFVTAAASSTILSSDPSSGDDGINYFETNIRPILFQNCYSCHSDAQTKSEGNLTLDSREGWLKGGDQGQAIVPGDPQASLLIQAVRYQDSSLQMPPTAQLSKEDVAKLEHWVKLGAPAPLQLHSSGLVSPADPESGRRHWAFQPIGKPTKVDWQAGMRLNNPIDHWVTAGQAAERLQASQRASDDVLLRRLYYVLHGLPPTAAELLEFEQADDDPQSYAQVVDRLLSSPRFGERWGRHWLDLARYADSNGSDENFLFREAWRYRNWVFDAINRDMPFDQFTLLQLAGDLLPFEDSTQRDEQRIATGFLLLGPKVLLGNNPENQEMEIADEQIDTIGRIYFAQTLGCARCHDHKFDPVPTKDYYALAGIFTSTQIMEQRYMLGEQRVMEQLIGLGDNGAELDSAYEEYWRERPKLGEKKAKAREALESLQELDEAVFHTIVTAHSAAVATEATEVSRPMEERIAAQLSLVEKFDKAWAEPPAIPPRAMISTDREAPHAERIRIAGQFNKPGDVVPRGFLTVLGIGATQLPDTSSGRLELAQWLTNHELPSGQLAARVLANRVWFHLIGRGIVRTVDNFGRTGEGPSHPELLDHLARELIDSGWSLKSLIRQVVLSETFQRSSDFDADCYGRDPDNIFFWRYNRRRLDPESFRDWTMSLASSLDTNRYLSTVHYLGDQATAVGPNTVRRRTDFACRSVYLPVIRNDLPELFEIMDFADPQVATGMRRQTIVPTQALFLLNDEQLMDAATKVAQQAMTASVTDSQVRVAWLFRKIIGKSASQGEMTALMASYGKLRLLAESSTMDPHLGALSTIAHALFASSRFQFIE